MTVVSLLELDRMNTKKTEGKCLHNRVFRYLRVCVTNINHNIERYHAKLLTSPGQLPQLRVECAAPLEPSRG